MDKKVTLAQLKEVVQEAYDQVKTNTGGKNADYIPYLANVNKDLFGISVCLLNGQTIHVGDTDYRFGIESVSKVHTAILALRQYGAKEILEKIGADATGLPFNSIIAILLENDHPSTPLVNAGAISACSMVKPIGDSAKKWDAIVENVTDLCGSAPQLIDELYKSESDTNFNNRSIAWLLKNYNRIYDDPDMALDLYTRQCSLGVTALQLSVAAGTIANGGVNPVTKKEVFDASLAPKITAMIAAVGFYEHTGDWMYTSGIPAKTGVGGGVMGVLPGQFGIAAFAPPLDGAGNSVKAQLAIQYVMNKLGLNVFSDNHLIVADYFIRSMRKTKGYYPRIVTFSICRLCCPLCRRFLLFFFRIILLFLFIRLLNQIRNIDCKDRKHHHSQSCQQHREYPTGSRHRNYIRSDGSHIHKCPPQSVSVVSHQRIHFMLKYKEGKTGEIDRCQQHRQIRDEQTRSPVVSKPSYYDSKCISSPQQRNKPKQISDLRRECPPIIGNNVLVRDCHQQKDKVRPYITPFMLCQKKLQYEIKQKPEANPQLDFHVRRLRIKRNPFECIYRNTNDQKKGHQ